jgi:hypothetical protein
VALTLAAGNNKIEYLPPEIFTPLQALRELHLYKNKITAVPPEIGNLVCKSFGVCEIYGNILQQRDSFAVVARCRSSM